jgi:hypothetical protein
VAFSSLQDHLFSDNHQYFQAGQLPTHVIKVKLQQRGLFTLGLKGVTVNLPFDRWYIERAEPTP